MNKEIKPLRLLIVEDDPGDYILLAHYLQISLLKIEKIFHAETMAAAAILVKEEFIDIALLDLTLPDSSGLDSVKTLNELLPDSPIIVLSGLSTIEIAIKSISLGAQDYIVKGEFDEKLLAKSIQYSLERKSINKILRESLERYALINKATQDIIWEWNLETNEIIRNDAFTTLFGYPNDPVMNNRNWILEKTHPSDKERLQTNIEYCIEHRLEKWQEEYRILASDGSYKDVLDRAFIQFDNTGKPSRMIGAMTDLTEKKNLEIELAEQQLNQQKLLLEVNIQAHEEEKKELGRELHDNINQMLAAVKMYLGMAKSGRGMPEDDLVGKSYNYLNEAMLEIRKLSHSLVAPSLGDMGLKEALQELIKNSNYFKLFHVQLLIDESYNEKNIDKNKVLMFYRIAQEQLNNVTKYAKAKNVVISVKTEDGHMYLSVIDNGVGFDTTKKANGIGLKNISSRIEFYSGKTSIISAPGKGCKLEVSIPL